MGCPCDPVTFGYKSVDEYYFEASSCRSIKDVRVPLLCVQVRYTLSGDGQHFVEHIDHLALYSIEHPECSSSSHPGVVKVVFWRLILTVDHV